MKSKHSVIAKPAMPPPPPKIQPAPPAQAGRFQGWQRFWFSPVSPVSLHALRVLAGFLFLAWLLPFAGDVEAMFGLEGWFDRVAYQQVPNEPPMPLGWSLLYMPGLDATVFYWAALTVFLLFTLGLATRITSVLTWLFVVSFLANPATRFEADYVLGILAFYLMIGYLLLGQWSRDQTLAGRLLGNRSSWLFWPGVDIGSQTPSYGANFAVRLWQVHFALIVVASGLHKLQFGAWWSGTAFWYGLHSPFTTNEAQIRTLMSIRGGYLFVLSLTGYIALAWQLCFQLFAWRSGRMRIVLVGGAVLGWLACLDIFKLPLFGPIYLIGCLSNVKPEEWLALRSRAARLFARVGPKVKETAATSRTLLMVATAGFALLGTACPPTGNGSNKPPESNAVVPTPQPLPTDIVPPDGNDAAKTPPLQRRIDAAVQEMRNRELLLNKSHFWTVFHAILGVGPESAYLKDLDTGQRVKALDYICKGGAVPGLKFLAISSDRADVETVAGSGTSQGHQDQFIAEMAQWGMPRDRKIMVQGKELTFEAFTLFSKERTSVKAGQELSWAIVIISQYYGTDLTWTNSRKETLQFDDVVRYEMHQPIKESPVCGGTHRLFGLTWAYHLHMAKGGQKTAVWKEVEELTRRYMDQARREQNLDGAFSTEYFRGPGNNQTDLTLRIHSTGHILEWLALALSDEELRQPWMESAVNALSLMILNNRNQGLDGGAVYHAVHGLEIYRNRVFGPTPFPPMIPHHP